MLYEVITLLETRVSQHADVPILFNRTDDAFGPHLGILPEPLRDA